MDKVDLLFKVKQLEKTIASLTLENKQLKKQLKLQESVESKLLKDCERLYYELAELKPFNDADVVIVKSKLNTK